MWRILSVSMFVLTSLAACKPSPDHTEPAAADAGVEAARPSDPGQTTELPPAAPLEFRVMREGGIGIDAQINRIDPSNNATFYASVPEDGVKIMDKACTPGERFQAKPVISAFQLVAPKECDRRIEFTLLSTKRTLAFMQMGDEASRTGDLLGAQSSYGIAADRLIYAQPDESRRLRILSTVAAGRALGVAEPVSGAPGNEHPTAEFKERIRVFQNENSIEDSKGELDAATRESISRMRLRGDIVVVPPRAAISDSPAVNAAKLAAVEEAMPAVPEKPRFEASVSTREMLAAPASPEAAAIVLANRKKARKEVRPAR